MVDTAVIEESVVVGGDETTGCKSAERVRWVRKGCSPGMSPRPGNPLKSTLDWPPADELGPETDDGSFQSSFA